MIVLFTDFGFEGPYLGQVRAVLQRQAPGVPVIDLFADAPACAPHPAAYLLAAYAPTFPAGSIFLAVVDPGVGGSRPPVIVSAGGHWYVGPGNGLFSITARRDDSVRAWTICWRPQHLSSTFHGRDLFAPVAACLARGVVPRTPWAEPLAPAALEAQPPWPDDLPAIVYVDHFGNAMTGLRAARMPADTVLRVRERSVSHAATYAAVPAGEPFWYENANGLVEIAVAGGRAAEVLGLSPGDPVSW